MSASISDTAASTMPASIFLILIVSMTITACAGKPDRPGFAGNGAGRMPSERIDAIRETMLARFDADGDGAMTCADVTTARSELFVKLDTDGDDSLSPKEYGAVSFEDRSFRFFEWNTVDSDRSGGISLAEFKAVPASRFSNIDTDDNCIVTTEEIVAFAREQMAGGNPTGGQRPGGTGGRRPRNVGV